MAKTIAVRIDESILKAVDAAARPGKRGRSEVVREALDLWLKRRAVAEKVRRHREGYKHRPLTREEFEPVLRAQTWPK